MDKRPNLNKEISVKDLNEFYWLKEELVDFCRREGIKSSGGKIEITQRIAHFLSTGEKDFKQSIPKKRVTSTFDWNKEKLTLETLITDNYKNSENVRLFFQQHIGSHFKFNVKFMNWMKANVGKSMKQAIQAWQEIQSLNKKSTSPKEIAPQFEYNRYLRDFLADNPNQNRDVGIKLWKIKRSQRGDNVYNIEDLKWIGKS